MKMILLFSAAILAFLFFLVFVFKPVRHRQALFLLSSTILVVTLFFGLKPKGYRFVNGAHWLKQGNGIVFTNTGMIYSEKSLGVLGITDSITLIAEYKPHWNRGLPRFITLFDRDNQEIFTVDQFENGFKVSLWQNGTF